MIVERIVGPAPMPADMVQHLKQTRTEQVESVAQLPLQRSDLVRWRLPPPDVRTRRAIISASPPSGLKPAPFIYKEGRSTTVTGSSNNLMFGHRRRVVSGGARSYSVIVRQRRPEAIGIQRSGVFERPAWTWCMRLRPSGRWCTERHHRCCRGSGELDEAITRRGCEDEVARRLMTIPGIGPITATAIAAIAPPAKTLAKGGDFAAWLRLVPKRSSTGGKQKLGAISRMGERTLRRLLIIGSSAVVVQARKRGAPAGSWLRGMLARKPRMLVAVALASKMARTVWALLVKHEDYRAPVAVAAQAEGG